ncbi:MAG: hypothetical protein K6F55_07380 [Eubacterium sp.]|nr:hypothetical protein [Eubacterium sp.]
MHNFKKVLAAVGIIISLLVILWAADYILYPCTFMRNDIHAISTRTFDDVYVGTSHGKMNIDPETIEKVSGRTGHNLCVGGEYPEDVLYLTKLMIEKGHTPQRLIYEVSPGYFVREKEEGNNYLLFYHEFPISLSKLDYFRDSLLKCNFRTLCFPWYEYDLSYELKHAKETVKKKSSRDYSENGFATETQRYHESGFIERYPVDLSDADISDVDEWFPEDIVDKNMKDLEETISLCKDNGIEFVAITTPLSDMTYEGCKEGSDSLNTYYADFFEGQGVRYINFNYGKYYDMTAHDLNSYTDLDGHMNGDAARKFSDILAKVLAE